MAVRQLRRQLDPLDELRSTTAAANAAIRSRLRAILRCEERGYWVEDGSRNFAEWVGSELSISPFKARRYIACAHALEELPLTEEALVSGRLGIDKVAELTRFATPDTEKKLIPWAGRVSISTIKARADEAEVVPVDRVRDVDRSRCLDFDYSADGLEMYINGRMPALEGSPIKAAIDELAEELKKGRDLSLGLEESDGGTIDQCRADALLMYVSGGVSGMKPLNPTLVVHSEVGALIAADGSGTVENGPALPPTVMQQLSCDCRLQHVLNENGRAVGIGHESEKIPNWMRRELLHRDRECQFPGCCQKLYAHGHHVTPYPGSPTDLQEIVLLCPYHHKMVHLWGWRVTLSRECEDPVGIEWWRPDGRRFERGPAPPPGRDPLTVTNF